MGDYNTVSKQISDLISGSGAAQDAQLKSLRDQYGYQDAYNNLQGIRRNVSDTEKALSDLPDQMKQRTAGTLTTAGQLQRLVNSESDPISKNLATLNKSQGLQEQGMADINNLVSEGMNRYQQNYANQLANLGSMRDQIFQAQEAAKARAAQQALAVQQRQWAQEDIAKAQQQQMQAEFDKKFSTTQGPALYNWWMQIKDTLTPDQNMEFAKKMTDYTGVNYDVNGNMTGMVPRQGQSITIRR